MGAQGRAGLLLDGDAHEAQGFGARGEGVGPVDVERRGEGRGPTDSGHDEGGDLARVGGVQDDQRAEAVQAGAQRGRSEFRLGTITRGYLSYHPRGALATLQATAVLLPDFGTHGRTLRRQRLT